MKIYSAIPVVVTIALLGSCKKVVHVDYHTTAPQVVIEANINDQPGPYTVKISKSKNYNDDNTFPAVSGATVVVTDNNTMFDTLSEVRPGIYKTHTITGTPGHVYKLLVKTEGKQFEAVSTMPYPVKLDSIYTMSLPEFDGAKICATPVYTDPAYKGNCYHYVEYVNDTETRDVFAFNDDFLNGQAIEFPLSGDRKLEKGDKVAIEMQSIDAHVYQYYNTLFASSTSATPANPVSNISGGALGYFSAHTSSLSKTIVVQ